jgi:hypothetical protein
LTRLLTRQARNGEDAGAFNQDLIPGHIREKQGANQVKKGFTAELSKDAKGYFVK